MSKAAPGTPFAPFLSDLRVEERPEGPFLQARFHRDALSEVALPFPLPDHVARAVDKRRAEFAAGRLLAHLGQRQLGLSPGEVAVASTRAPLWPVGLTGSITHSRDRAAVWLSRNRNLSLGLDIEPQLDARGLDAVRTRVLDDVERARWGADPWAAAVVFSGKETLFKALYPQVQRFFGFEAARAVELTDQRLVLTLTTGLGPAFPTGRRFEIGVAPKEQPKEHRGEAFALTWLAVPWKAHATAKGAQR